MCAGSCIAVNFCFFVLFFPVLRLCFKVKVKIRVKVSVQQVDHLVEPEIVRLQKSLKFGEKLVVVKAINGLHVTSTVVQIARDLC